MMKYASLCLLLSLALFSSCGVQKSLRDRPHLEQLSTVDTLRVKHNDTFYTVGKNSLRKNKLGLWELYAEGNPLQRGYAIGSLSRELIHKQEDAFMDKVTSMVDSPNYLHFLGKVVAWYNRKLYRYVDEEYKEEIYGMSRYYGGNYDDFAKPYVRSLYLHAAHDIGHALQDLMLVGCTSFAVKDEKTSDGELLIARNLDFYAGDEFAEEKVIYFINPDQGYKFMSYSWPGMMGVVSGMNEKGLTVTINAGKSKIPFSAKTPISLVTREILQYAKNTTEAIEIAKKREVFVSESIMIGSAAEHKAILIEVSPRNFGVYEVPNSSELICSNHFQSKAYKNDRRNQETIKNSHTQQRYDRMEELLNQTPKLDPIKAATILRNKDGIHDEKLGYGNEMAINQLLAHHGIIFKPEERKVWVSSSPYQLGAFAAYDLDEVFTDFESGNNDLKEIDSLQIAEDPFVHSLAFKKYEEFRKERQKIENSLKNEERLSESELQHFETLNPDLWETYYWIGKYHYAHRDYKKAVIAFKQAQKREITTELDKKMLANYIKKCYRKL